MKKILNCGCSSISYNEDYICAAGNVIELISRESNKKVYRISGCKNTISTAIASKHVYAKNTSGQYFVFDLETGLLISKTECREKENSSNDYNFFRIESGVIFDILISKSGDTCAVKYDLLKNYYEELYLADNNFRCKNYILNNDKAYFLFTEKCFLNKEKPKCIYFEVDFRSMKIKTEKIFSLENAVCPLALVSSHSILTKDKEIVDINTLERFPTILKKYFENNDFGYKYSIIPAREEYVILVYSKEFLVYNLKFNRKQKRIICEIPLVTSRRFAACRNKRTSRIAFSGEG